MQDLAGYFDANATTPLRQVAREALIGAIDSLWANPGAPYKRAAAVHRAVESSRESIGGTLAVDPERIVFLSGATEANNMVFAAMRRLAGSDTRICVSSIEHPSVLEPAAAHFGDRLHKLAVGADGRVDPAEVEAELRCGDIALVSVMAANNETGAIQPWREIASMCRARGVPFHCDASQLIGKESFSGIGDCDFISACAHKFGGPKGTGFLVTSDRWGRVSGAIGGGQERDQRAGTEDAPSILAMTAALEEAAAEGNNGRRRDAEAFAAALCERLPGTTLVASNAPRLYNTLMVILPDFRQTRWVAGLDRRGFQVSTGSACSSSAEGPSHVLLAMGTPADEAERAIRISAGWWTTADDWTRLLDAICEVHRALRGSGG